MEGVPKSFVIIVMDISDMFFMEKDLLKKTLDIV